MAIYFARPEFISWYRFWPPLCRTSADYAEYGQTSTVTVSRPTHKQYDSQEQEPLLEIAQQRRVVLRFLTIFIVPERHELLGSAAK